MSKISFRTALIAYSAILELIRMIEVTQFSLVQTSLFCTNKNEKYYASQNAPAYLNC